MSKMWGGYQTQWAGQFGVAHELCRRGYLVTFTTGNAPRVDLLCQSPKGVPFSLQVKSVRGSNSFLFQPSLRELKKDLFFVLVNLRPDLSKRPEYFVLSQAQLEPVFDAQDEYLKERARKRGKPYADFGPGINYSVLKGFDFLEAWENLPA